MASLQPWEEMHLSSWLLKVSQKKVRVKFLTSPGYFNNTHSSILTFSIFLHLLCFCRFLEGSCILYFPELRNLLRYQHFLDVWISKQLITKKKRIILSIPAGCGGRDSLASFLFFIRDNFSGRQATNHKAPCQAVTSHSNPCNWLLDSLLSAVEQLCQSQLFKLCCEYVYEAMVGFNLHFLI